MNLVNSYFYLYHLKALKCLGARVICELWSTGSRDLCEQWKYVNHK